MVPFTKVGLVNEHHEHGHAHTRTGGPGMTPSGGSTNARSAHHVASVVLRVNDLQYASEKAVVEKALSRRPGVLQIDANPIAQTATVIFDPNVTTESELMQWVKDCGYHSAGPSVPSHIFDPAAEEERQDHPSAVAGENAEHVQATEHVQHVQEAE